MNIDFSRKKADIDVLIFIGGYRENSRSKPERGWARPDSKRFNSHKIYNVITLCEEY